MPDACKPDWDLVGRLGSIAGVIAVFAVSYAVWALAAHLSLRRARRANLPPADGHSGRFSPVLASRSFTRTVRVDDAAARERSRARWTAGGILAGACVAAFVLPGVVLVALLNPAVLPLVLIIVQVMAQNPQRGVPQRISLGVLLPVGGLLALSLDFAAAAGYRVACGAGGPVETHLAISVGSLVAAAIVWQMARRGHIMRAPELLAKDERRFVLYLRSFHDDDLRIWTAGLGSRSVFDLLLGPRAELFEEVVRGRLAKVGPVIAVGEPGEWAPPPAASREYLEPSKWSGDVEGWLNDASIIVLAVGRTPGVRWELERIRALNHFGKLVLLLPPLSERELADRLEYVGGPGLTDVSGTLAAVLEVDDTLTAYKATRRDEWAYRAAVEAAVLSRLAHPASAMQATERAEPEEAAGDRPTKRTFHLALEGQTVGPFSLLQLRALATKRRVAANSFANQPRQWIVDARTRVHDGARWLPLGDVPDVFSSKEYVFALLLSVFLGFVGADRFYLGKPWSGLAKLVTSGGFGLFWLFDIVFLAVRETKDGHGRPLR